MATVAAVIIMTLLLFAVVALFKKRGDGQSSAPTDEHFTFKL